MHLTALLANSIWGASNLASCWRFRGALRNPQNAQQQWLRAYLETNANTEFGRQFGFSSIRSYDEFKKRVPIGDYESFAPWINRIRDGHADVLTRDCVTHLVPTSGSSGARKLIPFTVGLLRDFNAAIGPWLFDLQKQFPSILCGRAYWSITPAFQQPELGSSSVPIGFDTDVSYLGSIKGRLARATMAVPGSVLQATSLEEFQRETLLHLVDCRDLRLVSVWHPSFLTLLLDALPEHWSWLMGRVRRSRELRCLDPLIPEQLWPRLRLVSCWGESSAEAGIRRIQQLLPHVTIQRKGLLATEGVVTIPFARDHVLAVTSHFFEFLDPDNRVHTVQELRPDLEYDVVVTTNGGLCRYRLHDRVKVTGFMHLAPCLRFLGRIGNVSDYCGEKLSELFVSEVLGELLRDSTSQFTLLAPDTDVKGIRYTLYLEGVPPPETANRLDALLKQNPQYEVCRSIGQLQFPQVFLINSDGYKTFVERELSSGIRVGDIKPASLSNQTGWTDHFTGEYLTRESKTVPMAQTN